MLNVVQVQDGRIAIVDDTGAIIGIAAAPLRVDPTGTTTQPVSLAAFPPLPIPVGAATEATLLLVKAKTDNLDVALSTRASDAGLAAVYARQADGSQHTIVDASALPTGAATEATLTTRATEATLATRLSKADFEARVNTLGQKAMAASTPVVLPSDQIINVQFASSLPKIVNLSFDKSEGAIVAGAYKRVLTYTVPAEFSGYLIRFTSQQSEAAFSQIAAETNLGSHNDNTNVYTAGSAYASPQWASLVYARVTTAYAAGAGNVVLTVGYTNEVGTAGQSGTITIPKGSAVDAQFGLVLQAGDLGLRSIQTVSGAPSLVGVCSIIGIIQLVVHRDLDTASSPSFETIFAPGAISFPTGTVLGIAYAGGVVSKQRTFDALIQLVAL